MQAPRSSGFLQIVQKALFRCAGNTPSSACAAGAAREQKAFFRRAKSVSAAFLRGGRGKGVHFRAQRGKVAVKLRLVRRGKIIVEVQRLIEFAL